MNKHKIKIKEYIYVFCKTDIRMLVYFFCAFSVGQFENFFSYSKKHKNKLMQSLVKIAKSTVKKLTNFWHIKSK